MAQQLESRTLGTCLSHTSALTSPRPAQASTSRMIGRNRRAGWWNRTEHNYPFSGLQLRSRSPYKPLSAFSITSLYSSRKLIGIRWRRTAPNTWDAPLLQIDSNSPHTCRNHSFVITTIRQEPAKETSHKQTRDYRSRSIGAGHNRA